jgi:hypothetical protein
MTYNPKPKAVDRYFIVDKNGNIVSDRERTPDGAWASARFKLGYLLTETMKEKGFKCERGKGVAVNFNQGVSSGDFLHMRLGKTDADRLEKLIKHYSTPDSPATKTWVVRQLMIDKLDEIRKKQIS